MSGARYAGWEVREGMGNHGGSTYSLIIVIFFLNQNCGFYKNITINKPKKASESKLSSFQPKIVPPHDQWTGKI